MNWKRILILSVLAVFCIGICTGAVSAVENHTFKTDEGATFTVDQQDYDKLVKYNDKPCEFDAEGMEKCISTKTYDTNKKVKLNQVKYKKVKKSYYKKVPVYKYKKVRTYKWKVKKVLDYETWDYSNGAYYDCDDKSYSTVNKYWNSKKWKYCGSSYKTCSDSYSYIDSYGDYVSYDHTKFYTHFKTKVYYYKKVKYVHHYKKVKKYKYVWKKVKTTKKTYTVTATIFRGLDYNGAPYTYWYIGYGLKNHKYSVIKGNYKYVVNFPQKLLGLPDGQSPYSGKLKCNQPQFHKKVYTETPWDDYW